MRTAVVALVASVVAGGGGFWAGWEAREQRLLKEVPDAVAVQATIDSGAAVDAALVEAQTTAEDATDAAAAEAERALED